MRATLIAVLLLLVVTPARASGQFAARDYRDLEELERSLFVLGFVEAMSAAGFTTGLIVRELRERVSDDAVSTDDIVDAGQDVVWGGHIGIGECLDEWDVGQYLAVLDRYVEEHPEIWDQPITQHFFRAVQEACASRGL